MKSRGSRCGWLIGFVPPTATRYFTLKHLSMHLWVRRSQCLADRAVLVPDDTPAAPKNKNPGNSIAWVYALAETESAKHQSNYIHKSSITN